MSRCLYTSNALRASGESVDPTCEEDFAWPIAVEAANAAGKGGETNPSGTVGMLDICPDGPEAKDQSLNL